MRYTDGAVWLNYADPIGSARVITSSSGTLCYDSDFYPFGGERNYTNSCGENYKFTGLERDTDTPLSGPVDHSEFRQYSSSLGRWLSPDPLGGHITNPQSLNRYAYVLNNPTALTDPLGLDSTTGYGPVNPGVGCPGLPNGLPASAYQQAQQCETWFGKFKFNVGFPGCMAGEYGCGGDLPGGGNYTYGEDIFDALAGDSETQVWVDANGNIGFTVNPSQGILPGNSLSFVALITTITTTDGTVLSGEVDVFPPQGPANIQTEFDTIAARSPNGQYNGLFSAASNSGFSPGYPGNANFKPTGFVCVTCATPAIRTQPPKPASATPKPLKIGAPAGPGLSGAASLGSTTVLLPMPSFP